MQLSISLRWIFFANFSSSVYCHNKSSERLQKIGPCQVSSKALFYIFLNILLVISHSGMINTCSIGVVQNYLKFQLISLIHLQQFTYRLTRACVYQRMYTCMHVPLHVLVYVPPRVLSRVCLHV